MFKPTPPRKPFNRGVACGSVLPITRYAATALPAPDLSATLDTALFQPGSARPLLSSKPAGVPASHQPDRPVIAFGYGPEKEPPPPPPPPPLPPLPPDPGSARHKAGRPGANSIARPGAMSAVPMLIDQVMVKATGAPLLLNTLLPCTQLATMLPFGSVATAQK